MATKKFMSLDRLTEYDALIKQEIVDAVSGKANSSHTHDDRYYTESEIDTKIAAVNTSITNITGGTTVVKKAEYATSAGSASTADEATHAASADTATTAGSATKATQDGDGKVISSTYETKTDASAKLTEAKSYTDTKVSGLASTSSVNSAISTAVTNHNGATDAHADIRATLAEVKEDVDAFFKDATISTAAKDTLKEIQDYIASDVEAAAAMTASINNKSDKGHGHAISEVSGLQSALDGKAAASHGTHVTFDSTNAPVMDGTASAGTASTVARSDHKHPTDTSRASKTEFDTHVADTTKHITSTERTNWGAAYTHSQAAHAPSNAEKNQNAFSNVKVGSVTVAADTTTDTLTLVAGTNVQITADANADSVTISATDTVYTHPTSGVTAGTYRSVTVNAQGHVTAGSNPTTLSGYGITDAASKTHSHAISDITNLQTTLTNASTAILANTSSIDAHTTRIEALENKTGEGFEEITSAEIQALFA